MIKLYQGYNPFFDKDLILINLITGSGIEIGL